MESERPQLVDLARHGSGLRWKHVRRQSAGGWGRALLFGDFAMDFWPDSVSLLRIAARQLQFATGDEQRSVRIGKRAPAGFCGGNAGKLGLLEKAEERKARDRCLQGRPGDEIM